MMRKGDTDDYDNDPSERNFSAGVVPIGTKKSVSCLTSDGVQATKDKIVMKLRACIVCRLIAGEEQFISEGCPNCPFLELQGSRQNVWECTTTQFSGMMALMKPETSWAARYLQLDKGVPGCYAAHVSGELPERVRDEISFQLNPDDA